MPKDVNIDDILDEIFGEDEKLKSEIRKSREQNNEILWINFKSKLMPLLDQMVSGSGLTGYEIKKQKTTQRATIKAVVRLYAVEAVEDWDITIELADNTMDIVG